jgi:hypothetical protein
MKFGERITAIEALRNLVVKLRLIENPVNNCIVISQMHGIPYVGPNWLQEMVDAERVLSEEENEKQT